MRGRRTVQAALPVRSGALLAGALLLAGCSLAGSGAPLAGAGETSLAIQAISSDPARAVAVLDGPGAAAVRHLLGPNPPPQQVEGLLYLAVKPPGTVPATGLIPLLARLEWSGSSAHLVPRTSLTPGLTYVAVFEGPRLSPPLPRLTAGYTVPVDRRPSTARVTAIYPRQTVLPANLLKFYVHFSEPMAEGRVFEHVRMLDSGGQPLPQAFREVELWAEGHHRLTLWVNPGRTKRALGLSESLGPVLEPNRDYTLTIDPGLPDQRGRPLANGRQHRFRTSEPDHAQPRIETWTIDPPPAGGRAPLAVRFPEPLDHSLASRVIGVEDAAGRPLPGQVAVGADGRAWSFVPETAWTARFYALVAGGELEDLAGNSLLRPFETLPGQGAKPATEAPQFRREFEVRARER